MQLKPLCKMTFRNVGGMWRRVDSREPQPPTLAEVLKEFDLQIDDRTEFARIKDYENQLEFKFLQYGGTITLTIWKMQD